MNRKTLWQPGTGQVAQGVSASTIHHYVTINALVMSTGTIGLLTDWLKLWDDRGGGGRRAVSNLLRQQLP